MAQVKQEPTAWEDSANLNLGQHPDLNLNLGHHQDLNQDLNLILKQDPDCGDAQSFVLPLVKTEPEEFNIPAFQELSVFHQSIKEESESSDCDTDNSEDCSSDSSVEETHKCFQCWRVFDSSSGLKIHSLKMHEDIYCPVCGKMFRHKKAKLHHVRYTLCAQQYKTMPQTMPQTRPLHSVAREKPDNCPLCLKVKYQCPECGERFTSQYDLTLHQRIHEDSPFHCSVCSKAFYQRSSLELHARTHTGKWPFLCSICGKGFLRLWNLKQHVEKHETKSGKGLRTSAHHNLLQKHVMTPHLHLTCPLCPKAEQAESRLQSYLGNGPQEDLQTHTDNQKRTHSICGKNNTFETLKCPFCTEEFPKMIFLKRHMQIHIPAKTPEGKPSWIKKSRAIRCTTCSLEFQNGTDLLSHVLTHSEEKPLLCQVCGTAFTTSGSLLLHMRAKHHSSTSGGKLEANGRVNSRLKTMDSFPPSKKPRLPLCSGWRVVLTRLSTHM